jgi:alkylation response protein AidB-like acyl-CoA dehydrogenase
MNFEFSDEQYAIRDSVRELLQEKFGAGALSSAMQGAGAALWTDLAELGAFSMLVPEKFDGAGLNFIDLALVLEEYGRASLPQPIVDTIIATDAIVRFGSDEQKARLLTLIATGRMKVAVAVPEPTAGFDVSEIASTATRFGASWRLSGDKMLVPAAAFADIILVAVRFADEDALGLVLVEPQRQGVSLREQVTLDPSSHYHHAVFADVELSRADILGAKPSTEAVRRLFDAGAVAAATLMTGLAGKVLEIAVEYAKGRTQFGKPIGSFQAIKHKCADMAVAIESSRAAAYYAAWALAENAADVSKAVSIAKSFCGDSARLVCNEGIQIHGGMGFTWELGLHWYLRRAKVLEYSYGDASFHRSRVLAEALHDLEVTGS